MPGYGSQYWPERTPSTRRSAYPACKGTLTADAVIIGGGLTGCTAALLFAQAGLDVVLVEAGRLASAGTAGSLGAVVPEPDARFREVVAACGKRPAREAWRQSARGAKELAALITRLGIGCDLRPAVVWTRADSAEAAANLRRERAARREAGIVSPWAPGRVVSAEVGAPVASALKSPGFTFDPVRATLGLARHASARGARIFERSAVRRTRFTRKYAEVVLGGATIRTTLIYVATGEPGSVFSQLRRHVIKRDGFAVVTDRLSAPMRAETGKRSSVGTETGPDPHWLRWLPDDRALFAGALSRPIPPRQVDRVIVQRAGQLMYELSVQYPAISGLPATHAWQVPVVSTEDGLPWLGPHRNYPFHFFSMAFGWHGDSLAWSGARSALRFTRGESTRDDELLGFARHL